VESIYDAPVTSGSRADETMRQSAQQPTRRTLLTSVGRGWTGLDAELVHIPPGKLRAPGRDHHILGMHFGAAVRADCTVGDARARGIQKHGDMDFVPAGTDGSWEDDQACQILRLTVRAPLMERVAEDLGRDAATLDLTPRVRFRDPGIEAIASAIRVELAEPFPSDSLYGDHLAHALAIRLIGIADGSRAASDRQDVRGMSHRRLSALIDFIEANLDRKLLLADLATVAGLSITGLKVQFRTSIGIPVHQYVLRRRAEHARALIADTTLPSSEIAAAAGFSNQSHMAATMRRVLGYTPREIDRPRRDIRPIL
jgi:AraC family transcriptional regulator